MKPIISIVLPVYNVENYLERCLESIGRQKYDNLDIVMVDDGSTDGSGSICDEFAKKDSRARVYHKKNGGLSDARNFGIKKARGEIIAFVDSDDYIDKHFVDKMYEAMEGKDADIVVCGYNDKVPKNARISGKEAAIKLLTQGENIDIVAWNKLYKKNLFLDNDIRFPIGKIHEDTLTTYKVLSEADTVVYLAESLYEYVERENSITSAEKIEERLEAREAAAVAAIEYFGNDTELEQAAKVSLLLAKYAYLDFAIAGRINKKQGDEARRWILKHRKEYSDNRYMSGKLKMYNCMSTNIGGAVYWLFRKIKHE